MNVCLQAQKLGEQRTVEALARQFQDQIERILTEKVGGQTALLHHCTGGGTRGASKALTALEYDRL